MSEVSGAKRCNKCSELKPVSEYHARRPGKPALRHECKVCGAARTARWHKDNPAKSREYLLGRRYGLSPDEYRATLAAQGGVCALCGTPEAVMTRGRVRALCVDHCHRTGAVRALLCTRCNVALGGVERVTDPRAWLAAVAAYLGLTGPPTASEP